MKPREALLLLLDHVDYENGACQATEMVGAVLPVEVLRLVRLVAHQPTDRAAGTCLLCEQGVPHLREDCDKYF